MHVFDKNIKPSPQLLTNTLKMIFEIAKNVKIRKVPRYLREETDPIALLFRVISRHNKKILKKRNILGNLNHAQINLQQQILQH